MTLTLIMTYVIILSFIISRSHIWSLAREQTRHVTSVSNSDFLKWEFRKTQHMFFKVEFCSMVYYFGVVNPRSSMKNTKPLPFFCEMLEPIDQWIWNGKIFHDPQNNWRQQETLWGGRITIMIIRAVLRRCKYITLQPVLWTPTVFLVSNWVRNCDWVKHIFLCLLSISRLSWTQYNSHQRKQLLLEGECYYHFRSMHLNEW